MNFIRLYAIVKSRSELLSIGLAAALSASLVAQAPKPAPPAVPTQTKPVTDTAQTKPAPVTAQTKPVTGVTLPSDYIIGVEDVLSVVFWRDKEMSGDVVVRPDGKISLPLLNDVPAAGLTPEALAAVIQKAATKLVLDPGATVIVREIRSRKVYVIGQVAKQGSLQLGSEMNVLQAIGEMGGFVEGAKKGDVVIVRNESGTERRFKFNYDDVVKGKNLQQNIQLLPGDTILVR